jgi:hypothetical protein
MAWRVARSLDVLLGQFNAARPQRSKASDGAIGDAAHATRDSDHNPWYGPGIVTARDYTHDPAHGMDIDEITDQLVATRDPRIKYVIANRYILDSRSGNSPWKWLPYNGSNAHTKHFHLSVMANASCDDTAPWRLAMFGSAPAPAPVPAPPAPAAGTLAKGSTGAKVTQLQRTLNAWYPWLRLATDGVFGAATEAAVKELQQRAGLVVDGIAGPKTLGVLRLA